MEQINTQGVPDEKNAMERMNKTMEELRKYEKKNYRLNRFRALCSVLSLLLCICVAVYLYINGNHLMKKADEITTSVSDAGTHVKAVAEDLEKVEFEKLGQSMQEIADISKDTVQQANNAANGLDKIIESADTALENLNTLKIDALNKGIEKLTEVLENLKSFVDKLPFK